MHRSDPISATPIPVFSVMSPLWDAGGVAYQRVRLPGGELPHERTERRTVSEAVGQPLSRNDMGLNNPSDMDYRQTVEAPQMPKVAFQKSIPVQNEVKIVQNIETPSAETPLNQLSDMLEPFVHDTTDKQTLDTPIFNFDSFEATSQPLLPNAPLNVISATVGGVTPVAKDKKNKDIDYQNMNGHKHLQGNTSWLPVAKRGRHSATKSPHRQTTGHRKSDKKHRADRPGEALSSMVPSNK